jgi:hypothetical protein
MRGHPHIDSSLMELGGTSMPLLRVVAATVRKLLRLVTLLTG